MATLKDLIGAISQARGQGDDYFSRRFAEIDAPGPEYELAKAIAMAQMDDDQTVRKLRTAAQIRREEADYERAHPAPISEFQRAQLEHSKRAFDLDSRKTDAEIRNMDYQTAEKQRKADPQYAVNQETVTRNALLDAQRRADPEGAGKKHYLEQLEALFNGAGDNFDMSKLSPRFEAIIGDVDRGLSGSSTPEKLEGIKRQLRDHVAELLTESQQWGRMSPEERQAKAKETGTPHITNRPASAGQQAYYRSEQHPGAALSPVSDLADSYGFQVPAGIETIGLQTPFGALIEGRGTPKTRVNVGPLRRGVPENPLPNDVEYLTPDDIERRRRERWRWK